MKSGNAEVIRMKAKAKKHLETKTEGENEIMVFHVKEFDEGILPDMEYFYEDWDDYEDAYLNGISSDYNDNIVCIDIDNFLLTLIEIRDEIEKRGESLEDVRYDKIAVLMDTLKPYAGYTVYFDDNG